MDNPIIQFLFDSIVFVTPLLIVLMGELLLQRSGLVNLGLNGIILLSSVLSFLVFSKTEQLILSFIVAILTGIVLSVILGFVHIQLKLPILITGFAIALFGQNLTRFLGNDIVLGIDVQFNPVNIPILKSIPFLGPVLFQHTAWVYAAHLLVLGVWIWVFKSRFGKILIGLGDNPDGLYRRGYKTTHIRYTYLIFGGLLTGSAGFVYTFLVDLGWRGTYASYDGIGWFVFALLMIGNWRPGRTMLFAYLYTFMFLGFQLFQSTQTVFSVQAINLIPQAIIILLLAIIHIGKRSWMITPINKILSQEYTFIKNLNEKIQIPVVAESKIESINEG
ncbi:MAG: hypothetical protein CL609_06295 [Anaerolineaceae bacterium]|nr:hypothetical protein [Anaerolineaceae bacterium]